MPRIAITDLTLDYALESCTGGTLYRDATLPLLRAGLEQLGRGDYVHAAISFLIAASGECGNECALHNAAKALYHLGRVTEAASLLKQAAGLEQMRHPTR